MNIININEDIPITIRKNKILIKIIIWDKATLKYFNGENLRKYKKAIMDARIDLANNHELITARNCTNKH